MAIRYDFCERTATKLLLEQDLRQPRINVSKLTYDKDIIFDTFVNYCLCSGLDTESFMKKNKLTDGFLVKYGETNLVLSRGLACSARQNWTWAHEIGHIYLGHTVDGDQEEREANCFASQLLMPWCLVRYLTASSFHVNTFDFAEIFGVSLTAAANRLKTLRKRYDFPYSKLDAELLNKYKPYLNEFIKNAV